MRFANLHLRTALLASLILAASACQTAQRPVSLLPPGAAPAIKPAATPAPSPAAKASDAAAPQKESQKQEAPQIPAAAEASTPATSAPTSDPVADLVAKVEKEYQAGLANHQAGKTDEAKQNFDNALNALLGSNLDVRSDDRLQKEFERVVAGVNELYPGGTDAEPGQESAQDNSKDAQQKSEPAPIDVTNDETNGMTPAAEAAVKAKAEAEIKHTPSDLPLMMTDQVATYISYFSGRGRG